MLLSALLLRLPIRRDPIVLSVIWSESRIHFVRIQYFFNRLENKILAGIDSVVIGFRTRLKSEMHGSEILDDI